MSDPRFQFGSIAIDLTPSCTPRYPTTLAQGVVCVPPSCAGNSICYPGGRTFAQVRYRDLPDPAENLNRLLQVLAELQLPVQILAGREDLEAIERAVRPNA